MATRDPSSPADRRKNPARKKSDRRKSIDLATEAKTPDGLHQTALKRPNDESGSAT